MSENTQNEHKFWLMKSEPETFSIDDLKIKKVEMWDGTRNFQVRNMMRDDIKKGDRVLFYHSSAGERTGVVGEMEVVKEAYPDPTQFDPQSFHFDPKSDLNKPSWLCVDVKFVSKFPRLVTLSELKSEKKLKGMRLLMKGNRLSVIPVVKHHYQHILKLAK